MIPIWLAVPPTAVRNTIRHRLAGLDLTVVDSADDGFVEDADRFRRFDRQPDGLVGDMRVVWHAWPMVSRQGDRWRRAWQGPGRTRISAAERPRWRQTPPVGEETDQRPDRVGAAEAIAEPHGRAGEQVQRSVFFVV